MLLPLHRRLLAAIVATLIGMPATAAPPAVAAGGTSEAPPPAPMAVLPRATRPRRLRRHLSIRSIVMRLLGRRPDAQIAHGADRERTARRGPIGAPYARGPPR